MIHSLLLIALSVAIVGTLSSTVFFLLALAGVGKFARARRREAMFDGTFTPGVTIFKPLHGMEPQLQRNLESFFEQDYAGEFEILLGARTEADAGLRLAREVAARYPQVKAKFTLSGAPEWMNAKVWSLELMKANAAHDLFVISDSDVEVGRGYLNAIIAPFREARVGCVTCLYRGKPAGGIWSRLEALGMSVEMTSGALIANLLEGMKFALGPTMVVRRVALDGIGGFPALKDTPSDDFILGNQIAAQGWTVLASHYAIDHVVLNRRFWSSMQHHVRWMRGTRFSRPKGHLGTGLTFAMPYGLLGLAAAWALGHPLLGWALLGSAVVHCMLQSMIVGWTVVRDRRAVTWAWLYPLRDLMGFCFWAASYGSSRVVWRGEVFQLGEGGKMTPVGKSSQQSAVSSQGS